MNVLAVIADFQNFRLVTHALAFFANQFNIGEELHFHGDRTVTLAAFATSAGNVEGKMSRGVAMLLALRQGSEEFADGVKCLDVRHRIGSRSAAHRRLVHQHDLIDPLGAFHAIHFSRRPARDLAGLRSYRVVEHIDRKSKRLKSSHLGISYAVLLPKSTLFPSTPLFRSIHSAPSTRSTSAGGPPVTWPVCAAIAL